MPEIGEVARIVHYLRQHLVGKTLAVVLAQDDSSVFGKVGTSAAEVQSSLAGKRVLSAGQQGKYFWLIMSSPPHPVMHFGMTGWIHIHNSHTGYYRPKPGEDTTTWPPKHWKFTLETAETAESPKVEVAFTDARRFSRVRLVDCPADAIRKTTPLKENGPDPVIDKEVLTEEWLSKKLKSKHVPLKALLLDQAVISGIGNWVGDEILYHSRLHPEQYSDTFSAAQMSRLHASIMHICDIAVSTLADFEQFPEGWLFTHRWGKGKKDKVMKMPDGSAITFLTVGGRTSCVVPSKQTKTGDVAAVVPPAKSGGAKKAMGQKGKPAKAEQDADEDEEQEGSEDDRSPPPPKKRKDPPAKAASRSVKKAKSNGPSTAAAVKEQEDAPSPKNPSGGRPAAKKIGAATTGPHAADHTSLRRSGRASRG